MKSRNRRLIGLVGSGEVSVPAHSIDDCLAQNHFRTRHYTAQHIQHIVAQNLTTTTTTLHNIYRQSPLRIVWHKTTFVPDTRYTTTLHSTYIYRTDGKTQQQHYKTYQQYPLSIVWHKTTFAQHQTHKSSLNIFVCLVFNYRLHCYVFCTCLYLFVVC